MNFIDYLDYRFTDTDEIKRVNKYGISAGFDGFKDFPEIEYLYNKFKNEIHELIEETGYKEKQVVDEYDDEKTTIMKMVWLATSIYCLSRVDSEATI